MSQCSVLRRTSTPVMPSSAPTAVAMSAVMTSWAGQPLNVVINSTVACPSATSVDAIMPMSTTLTPGYSGSSTPRSASITSAVRASPVTVPTLRLPASARSHSAESVARIQPLVSRTMSVGAASETKSGASLLRRLHPSGWVALATLLAALFAHLFIDTQYLIAHFVWWWWPLLVAAIAMSAWHSGLNRLRIWIEAIPSFTLRITMVLAWAVFVLQFFNVITRYSNEYVEQDILIGEVVSLAWQSFGLMFLVAMNVGIRDGVNPRIDFWWINFSNKTKAALDFAMHTVLLLPFVFMSIRILQSYVASSLGRKAGSGEWPAGWRVWQSWEEAVDAGGLPVGPIKAFLLIGFGLFGLQLMAEVIKTGFVLIGRDDYGDIVERDTPQRIE
ncbi:MAG: TRAP transporter small permease subunit [Acidimicrobiaceae bacterium]|nr:TRAP transporter small permease subunit [Acidimicrobiaceae bacterium]MYE56402.1 TRAP transporter small permease subunit [Acidimicrobiaceae bacterium]